MQIKFKIALIFSLVTALILVVFMGFVYLSSQQNRESNFYLILEDRANLVAQAYLEKDELASEIYDKVLEQHLRKLPSEEELIIPISPTPTDTFDVNISDLDKEYLASIRAKKIVRDKEEDLQTVAIYYPDNQGNFIIQVTAHDEIGFGQLDELYHNLISGLIFSILIVFLVSWFFSTSLTKPILQMAAAVGSINTTNLSTRLPTKGSLDELDQLSVHLNEMLDRLETGYEIQKNFVSNASHELKTPLTVIVGEAEIALQKHRTLEEYTGALEVVKQEADKLTALINELLRLSEVIAGKHIDKLEEQFRIEDVLLNVQANLSRFEKRPRIVVKYDDVPLQNEDKLLLGNIRWIELAFVNIIKNALKYSEGEVHVNTYFNEDGVLIKVADDGIGIPNDEITKVTQPFYRASNVHGVIGQGLGLPLVDRIIAIHGGKLNITSELQKGTLVSVWLPFAPQV